MKSYEFVAHSTEVNCLAISQRTHQYIATGGEDFKVNVCRVGYWSSTLTLASNKSPIESLCFNDEERYLASGAMNGSIKIFDIVAGKLVKNVGSHQINTCALQFHPYGEFLVSGSVDSSVKLWDIRSKACIQTYNNHEKEITCVRFSPDGRWVATSSKDGNLLIWDLVASKLLQTIKVGPAHISSFEFNPEDFQLGAVLSSRNVRFWDLDTMEVVGTTPPDSNPIRTLCYSDDGKQVYTTTKDSLRAWSWENPTQLQGNWDVGWDRVAETRLKSNQLIAGSFNCNFVSIWQCDITELPTKPNRLSLPPSSNRDRGTSGKSTRSTSSNHENSSALPAPIVSPRHSSSPPPEISQPARYSAPPRVNPTATPSTIPASAPAHSIASSSSSSSSSSSYENEVSPSSLESIPKEGGGGGGGVAKRDARTTAREIANILQSSPTKKKWEPEETSRAFSSSLSESFWKKYQSAPEANEGKEDADEETGGGGGAGPRNRGGTEENFDPEEIQDKLTSLRVGSEEEKISRYDELHNMLPNVQSRFSSAGGAGAGSNQVMSGPSTNKSASALNPSVAPSKRRNRSDSDDDSYFQPLDQGLSSASVDEKESQYPLPQQGRRDRKTPIAAQPPANDRPQLSPSPSYSDIDTRQQRLPSRSNSASNANSANNRPASTNDNESLNFEVVGQKHSRKNIRNESPGVGGVMRSGSAGAGGGVSAGPRPGRRHPTPQEPEDTEACLESIERLLDHSSIFSTTLSQRLSGIKQLKRLVDRGNVSDVMAHLSQLSESLRLDSSQLVILTDFFATIEIGGVGSTLDNCVVLLKVFEAMLSDMDGIKSKHIVGVVMRCIISLLESFGELIRQTRAIMSVGSVDISREERLRKCNACYDVLYRIRSRIDQIRHQHRKNSDILDILSIIQPLIDNATS